jgi:hypothetical protein
MTSLIVLVTPVQAQPEIRELIEQLADSAFTIRDAATLRLLTLGEQALAELHARANDPDLERRWRIELLLQELRPIPAAPRRIEQRLAHQGEIVKLVREHPGAAWVLVRHGQRYTLATPTDLRLLARNDFELYLAIRSLINRTDAELPTASTPADWPALDIKVSSGDGLAAGLQVTHVLVGGNGERWGLRPGDTLLAAAEVPLYRADELSQVLSRIEPGQHFTLLVLREKACRHLLAQRD